MAGGMRICLTFLAGLLVSGSASGELSRDAAARLAVDVVLATNSRELRGSVAHQDQQGLTIAVRRNWLQEHEPAFAKLLADQEAEAAQLSRQKNRERLRDWLDRRRTHEKLRTYLESELERLSQPEPPAESESEFVLVRLDADEVRRAYRPQQRLRQLAAVAWELHVPDVESTRFADLEAAVAALDPQWEQRKIDLSDQLPAGGSITDEDWAAREAIVEHHLLEPPVEFQGTGDLILPVQANQPADAQAILSSLLEQSSLLGGLGDGQVSDWRTRATSEAERAGRNSVRVTRVMHDLEQDRISVECILLGRVVPSKESSRNVPPQQSEWRTAWKKNLTASARNPRPGALDQVRADPQVQAIMEATQALGLQGSLDQALTAGAVVLDLSQEVQDAWQINSERLLRRIDAPISSDP